MLAARWSLSSAGCSGVACNALANRAVVESLWLIAFPLRIGFGCAFYTAAGEVTQAGREKYAGVWKSG
jgi:hypothetical protein